MRMKFRDVKYLLAFFIALATIVGHVAVGYVFPLAACIVIAVSFITVYTIQSAKFLIVWTALVCYCYAMTDYLTYNPEGISAAIYRYTLLIMMAQLYSISLFIECIIRNNREYANTIICADRKKAKIEATQSLYNIYAIPVGITIVVTAMRNAISKEVIGDGVYLMTATICICILAGLHVSLYMYSEMLIRAIDKSEKKEDDKNEVCKEASNGESVRQDD